MDRETADTTTTVVLVLDGDTDAGYRMACKLLADGCRVAVTGRHPARVVRVMHGYSADRVLAIAADMTDQRQWNRVTQLVRDKFVRIDTVIRAEDTGASEATGGTTALRAASSETAVRSANRRAARSHGRLGETVWAQSSNAS
jgi:short-subunit dehydrogenase involved in D-alanine esterification of teichoic acids